MPRVKWPERIHEELNDLSAAVEDAVTASDRDERYSLVLEAETYLSSLRDKFVAWREQIDKKRVNSSRGLREYAKAQLGRRT